VQRWSRHGLERRERRCADGRNRRQFREQRELAFLVDLGLGDDVALGLRREAVDAKQEARVTAFELHRRLGGERTPGVEPVEDPAQRRRAFGVSTGIDRAGHDQPVDRTRHRNVVEAQPLGLVLTAPLGSHFLPVERALARAGDRVGDPEAEASVGQGEDLVECRRGAVATGVGDDHDLELQPLRGMDRQQADCVSSLLLGHRLQLLGSDRFLLEDEANEALDVGAPELLVRSGEPGELAHVGVAPLAVPLGEHREVVVVLGDERLTEALERKPAGGGDEPLVALLERSQQARITLVEIGRKLPLEPREERPAARGAPEEHETVVREADERRREHRDERLVVVAVVQEPQVREQVDDLLLPEVAATGRAVGGQAGTS
jgi:hypothetical protein